MFCRHIQVLSQRFPAHQNVSCLCGCVALSQKFVSLSQIYRALLWTSRALLRVDSSAIIKLSSISIHIYQSSLRIWRALSRDFIALLREYRALWRVYWGLFGGYIYQSPPKAGLHTSTPIAALVGMAIAPMLFRMCQIQLAPPCNTLQHPATPCNTLHHPASPCNILQHPAPPCTTLHHPAPPCNTLQHACRQGECICVFTCLLVYLFTTCLLVYHVSNMRVCSTPYRVAKTHVMP